MTTTIRQLTSPIISKMAGINHGFFTREGGVSQGLYASLNCGLGSHDRTQDVMENRARIARKLGGLESRIFTVHQVHSSSTFTLDPKKERPDNIPKADAIISTIPGLVVGVLTADCAPILFADPDAKVVAAAHAGWRGAAGGIIESTVDAMEKSGANRNRICAAIGPTISQRAYEVGPEFKKGFTALAAENEIFFNISSSSGKLHFDLPAYIVSLLRRTGIKSLDIASECTYDNELVFFSFRRATHRGEGDYGRQISAIVVA